MEKNLLRLMLVRFTILALALVVLFSFTPPETKHPKKRKAKTTIPTTGCTASCDTRMTDCYGGPGCILPGCTSVWKVPNVGSYVGGAKWVQINNMAVCYVPTGTPPWSSYTQVGRLMDVWLRPSVTKVVNATSPTGAIFQCTIFTNGDFYFQQASGPVPGTGVIISLTYSIY